MKKLLIFILILVNLSAFSQTNTTISNLPSFTGSLTGSYWVSDITTITTRKVSWATMEQQLIIDSLFPSRLSINKLRDSMFAVLNASIALKLNITDTANIRFRPHAGTNITITGTYPDITINSTGGGGSYTFPKTVIAPGSAIQLTGDTTLTGTGKWYWYGADANGNLRYNAPINWLLKDANGIYWQAGVTIGGALTTTQVTSSYGPLQGYTFTGSTSQYTLGDGTYATRLSLTTTGSSGASTFNPATGVLNVPQYSGGSGPTLTFTPTQNYNAYGVFVNNTLDSTRGGTIIGTAGAGFLGFTSQSARPSVPSGLGMREYVDSVGRRSYLGANNLSRSFDAAGQTVNRVYRFQDRNYTFGDSADVALKLNITDTANIRFRPHAGTNITLSGSYPDITFNAPGGGGNISGTLTSQRIPMARNASTLIDDGNLTWDTTIHRLVILPNTTNSFLKSNYLEVQESASNITGQVGANEIDITRNMHSNGTNLIRVAGDDAEWIAIAGNTINFNFTGTGAAGSTIAAYQTQPLKIDGFGAVGMGGGTGGGTPPNAGNYTGMTMVATTNGVTIGKASSTVTANSILDIVSTTKGILIPRMTNTQRNAIALTEGLLTYDTDGERVSLDNGVNRTYLRGIGRTTVADAAYTILKTDDLISYTTLTATRAVTPPASPVANMTFTIKDEAGTATTNHITFVGTLDGAVNPDLVNTNNGSVTIYYTGSAWFTRK